MRQSSGGKESTIDEVVAEEVAGELNFSLLAEQKSWFIVPSMVQRRNYIQARNLLSEAHSKLKDYEAILGRTRIDYEALRGPGVSCSAFSDEHAKPVVIQVTRQCWNHVFKHPHKRQSRVEKLERALCFDFAIKLLKKTTTYQEVSHEKDKGGNDYLAFGIIGYVRGNRIKVILRKQAKHTNAQVVLYSFFQMSASPNKNPSVD